MAEGMSQIVSPSRDILGTGLWYGLEELLYPFWNPTWKRGVFFARQLWHCMYLASAGYVQINWFWLQVLSLFFARHNSYSGIHSGCSFLSKFLNQVRWGKSEVGGVSDCIKSLEPAYCDRCPVCKPAWQSQGQIAGWGDLMLPSTSGGASSGFRACTWGRRRLSFWGRDMIPQCEWEILYRPSDVACSGLQQIWDELIPDKSAVGVFWIDMTCCQWGVRKAKMPRIVSFGSSFQYCLGPSVALRCSVSIYVSGARQLHSWYIACSVITNRKSCSSFGVYCQVVWCWGEVVFSYGVKMKHLPLGMVGIVSVPDIHLSPACSFFSFCIWDDFFLLLPSASFKSSSSHLYFL